MVKKKVKKKKTPVKIVKKTVTTTTTTTPHKKTTTKPKKRTVKKTVIRGPKILKEDEKLGRILIENFISLQKVMVNLSIKFEDLSSKISKLLELFEISARVLAEKDLTIEQTARDDTKILQEVGNLSEQNKIIARGLTLMHNRLSGEAEQPMERPPQIPPSTHPKIPPSTPAQTPFSTPQKNPLIQKQPLNSQPLTQPQPLEKPMNNPEKTVATTQDSLEGYQKSITSESTSKKVPT